MLPLSIFGFAFSFRHTIIRRFHAELRHSPAIKRIAGHALTPPRHFEITPADTFRRLFHARRLMITPISLSSPCAGPFTLPPLFSFFAFAAVTPIFRFDFRLAPDAAAIDIAAIFDYLPTPLFFLLPHFAFRHLFHFFDRH
jgi:hypothetical protein